MSLLFTFLQPIYNDAPEPWQIGFQDGASPGFEGIVDLHDSIFFYLVVISIGVFWILGSVIKNFNINNSPIVYKYSNHGTTKCLHANTTKLRKKTKFIAAQPRLVFSKTRRECKGRDSIY